MKHILKNGVWREVVCLGNMRTGRRGRTFAGTMRHDRPERWAAPTAEFTSSEASAQPQRSTASAARKYVQGRASLITGLAIGGP